jgi:hypothetical protein
MKKKELDPQKLKKAYYDGKLSQFLDEMMANGDEINKEEIESHLEEFQKERDKNLKEFKRYIDQESIPTVDVLFDKNSDPAQKEEWVKNRDYAIARASRILMDTARSIAQKQDIDVQKFSDYSHELTGLTYFLDQDVVFKKRTWKIRQMEIMEDYRCSRKEAEDHSMITNEYVEYKNAYNLREETENFIINARKEVSRYR